MPPFEQLFVKLALIVAMNHILLIYIAVATLQFFVEGGFVDCTGADVVCQRAEENCISGVHILVKRYEF